MKKIIYHKKSNFNIYKILEPKVIFTLDGVDVSIQCSKEDKIKDICQKFANKVDKNLNSLLFLYGGNQFSFQVSKI